MHPTIRHWLRETQYLIEYLLLLPLVTFARCISDRHVRGLSRVVARVAAFVLVKDRRWALRNLELVFGDQLTAVDRQRIMLASFENIVRSRIELLRYTQQWLIENVIEENGEYIRRTAGADVARSGKGIIFVTAHLGNFELIPAWCHLLGFPSTVMYRPQNNWRVEKLIMGSRTQYLPNVVARTTAGLMELGYQLQEGKGVGMLIDMNTLQNPVFVDFLGLPAASPPGAASLAWCAEVDVYLAVAVRQSDGKHRIIFHPKFDLQRTGNKKKDILAFTAQMNAAIEPYIRAFPEQYNWPHPRWRRRPDGSFWTLDQSVAEQLAERARSTENLADPPPAYPRLTFDQIDPHRLGEQLETHERRAA